MSSQIDRSNGFLPLVPLRHADPTAVGVWDMDRADGVMRPLELPAQGARDQLVLARLHGQPLAILHLDEAPARTTRASLIEAVCSTAGDAIIEHVTACGCLRGPDGAAGVDDTDSAEAAAGAGSPGGAAGARWLSMMLAAGDGSCPGATPSRPPGSAAVILCTTGTQQDALARSLRSLTRMDGNNFEIIVVDNRPSFPETRTLVEGFSSPVRVRYVAEPRPGLSRARNAGLAAARHAAFVAFTDDDVLVDPGWLVWLLSPFSVPRVYAVTGLVMPLRLASRAEKRFEHYAGFGKGVREATYDLTEHADRERFLYPYWGGMFGSGNSMAFRREALDAVGGFDPALGAGTPTGGGEDIAAFSDMILAGGQLVYQPRSLCWHEHRGDEQALRAQIRNYGIGLTAVLCRYLIRDRRFSTTVIGSLPAITRLARQRCSDRELDRMPADLGRLELTGRLLGPWRYMLSSRQARSRGNADAARQIAGGRRRREMRSGAADAMAGARSDVDQAGAQTRT